MTTKISGDNISAIANQGVTWNAVTVADGSTQLNASAGNGYFLDTNAGVIEVFLPSSPTRGDTVVLADYASNFATNNVLVNTGGILIDSVTTAGAGIDYVLNTNDLVVELVYVDSSKGWLVKENQAKNSLTEATDTNAFYIEATGGTVTTSGDYKTHVFTGDGCFVVSSIGNPAGSDSVDYVVIAGGGGGNSDWSGGSGAGGMRLSASTYCGGHPIATPTALPVSATTYPITVGGGGSAGSGPEGTGTDGSNSIFSTITSTGGGRGGEENGPGVGSSGGSGGGNKYGGPSTVGAGNTPPVSPPQGNPGGAHPTGTPGFAGGGGGAGGAGAIACSPNFGGKGGIGVYVPNTFFGPVSGCYGTPGPVCGTRYFASGSPAMVGNPTGPIEAAQAGGAGVGGAGNNCSAGSATAGTANTGGGGGSGGGNEGSNPGQAGGKGIVLIRYKYQ
jgi:hypothetical protein